MRAPLWHEHVRVHPAPMESGADMEKTYSPQLEDILDSVFRDFFPEKRVNKKGLRKDWNFLELAKKGF